MTISNIQVVPVRPDKTLAGFATVEVDGWLILAGIAIHVHEGGTITLAFPSRRDSRGSEHKLMYPKTNEAKEILTREVQNVWNLTLKEAYQNE